jgi:hypothetical protein
VFNEMCNSCAVQLKRAMVLTTSLTYIGGEPTESGERS